jgi:MFS family permease
MKNTDIVNEDYRASPELAAYYADRKLMWRNVIFIGICNLGWGFAFTITGPLIVLKLLDLGIGANIQGTIGSFNGWALSFLVMWFSWMSDHTHTRIGRRKPYLFAAAPFIIIPMVIFPFFAEPGWVWFLIVLQVISMIAMDMKASTFPLLNIDCVSRDMLARANSVLTIAGGVMGFLSMRYVGDMIKVSEFLPYLVGAGVMTATTAVAFLIKEPNIVHPATESFKPWSTFQVAARADKRIFLLIIGVAMVSGFMTMQTQWLWFWSKETLQLERGDIFSALSWASLVNIVLAYPVGWLIDRWGGLRVVLVYWVGQVACFAWAMNVHDKLGLIVLSLATTIVAPLFGAADIMIYKTAAPKDVGSITSTAACIRNGYNATLVFISGWVIHFTGQNYRVTFVLGIVMSSIGLLMFFVYRRAMQRGVALPAKTACETGMAPEPVK